MTRNPPPIDLSVPPAIEVRGAHKHYGALHAVDGIDLRIARGEIFPYKTTRHAFDPALPVVAIPLERLYA